MSASSLAGPLRSSSCQGQRSLTPRQEEVVRVIWDHLRKRGEYPSYRQLMEVLGINSPNGLLCHLIALQHKGWITGPIVGEGRGCHKRTRSIRLIGVKLIPAIEESEQGRRLAEVVSR